MKISVENSNVVIEDIKDFKLSDTFDCGQCFRFNPCEGGYIGTAYGKTVRITQSGDTITLHNTSLDDFTCIWRKFLDIDRDYGNIKKALSKTSDSVMSAAIEYGSGIHILKQELWETTISFIISASNNIPRIKKIIECLCKTYGTPHTYEGKTYYSFPDADTIAKQSEDDLSCIRAGFRTKYILACAKAVSSNEFDLMSLYDMDTANAKKSLMSLKGIGNKVADCITLFALNKFNSFPIDVWIKRIMEYCYFGDTEQSIPAIAQFAEERFGELGGIAQQYLFFYARSLKIGT